MKEFDLKRNASGYYDETAYKAITAAPKAGEIWKLTNRNEEILILKNHGTLCTALTLVDQYYDDSIEVISRNKKYSRPYMLSYTFNRYIGEYIKTITPDQLNSVLKAVNSCLGVKFELEQVVTKNEKETLEARIKALESELKEAKEALSKAEDKVEMNDVDELTYKKLYQYLIDRMIGAGG